jgi:hypothetical protein
MTGGNAGRGEKTASTQNIAGFTDENNAGREEGGGDEKQPFGLEAGKCYAVLHEAGLGGGGIMLIYGARTRLWLAFQQLQRAPGLPRMVILGRNPCASWRVAVFWVTGR